MPLALAVPQLQLFPAFHLPRHQQPRSWIPPSPLRRHRLPALVAARQRQGDGAIDGSLPFEDQPQSIPLTQPTMGQGGAQDAFRRQVVAMHRPAEAHVHCRPAGLQWLWAEIKQPWGASQQELLLDDHGASAQQKDQRQPSRHGSRGRLGRGMGLIAVGTTTAVGSPLRSAIVIRPWIASH